MITYSIIITGRVQGVFFRASAKEMADQLTVKGFAQNLPDGSVRIEVEGREENVKRFVDWCREGPPHAQVVHIDVEQNVFKNFKKFEIKR